VPRRANSVRLVAQTGPTEASLGASETGSIVRVLLRPPRTLGLTKISRRSSNSPRMGGVVLRYSVSATALLNFRRPFPALCLCLQKSVSRQWRPWFEETRFDSVMGDCGRARSPQKASARCLKRTASKISGSDRSRLSGQSHQTIQRCSDAYEAQARSRRQEARCLQSAPYRHLHASHGGRGHLRARRELV
jgi:hypothetical protein